MRVGGAMDLVDEIKRNGGEVGPATKWLGSWSHRYGTADFTSFFVECKNRGVQPLIFFWYWGDDISPNAINNGVNDKYQKNADDTPILKTRVKAQSLLSDVASRAKSAGVNAVFVIEHEFNKNGVIETPKPFNDYFVQMAQVVKANGCTVGFCPGIWTDSATIRTKFSPSVLAADILGLQTLLFRPRHPEADFKEAGPTLARRFAGLRGDLQKPVAIFDLGFSSYGGNYATNHPFSGGNGQTNEGLQAEAIDSVAEAMRGISGSVEFVCYRGLKDASTFNVANYGGYAERHVGLIDSTGRKKRAYQSIMEMAKPAPPPPPIMYTKEQYDIATQQRDEAMAEVTALRAKIAKARAELA